MSKITKTCLGNREIFARNLKRYIDASGKSQIEVATAVRVSKGTLSDWLSCRSYPRMDKIQALADYFGIQKSDLVEDINLSKKIVSAEDQKILDMFHKIPEEKREFVLSTIQSMIDNLLLLEKSDLYDLT